MDDKYLEKRLKLKSEIDTINNELAGLSDEQKSDWSDRIDQIDRCFKQFESDKHFIIATGMLKAGKSTLVDLLARTKKASLTGFGVDTTLRPALITMSDNDKGKILVYYKPNDADWKTAMQSVIDELRGLNPTVNNTPNKFELDEEHLKKTLCRIPSESDNCLTTEPLLVIVEVPNNNKSEFFKNNCVLLDMPGLDSGFSEQSKDAEKYKAFFDECDLLLFVQSSVSPINQKAGEYLKYIGLTRNESTYRHVQNVMNAKYWLKYDVTDEEQKKQAAEGKAEFAKKLGKSPDSIDASYVNLGMAYDSILEDINRIYVSEGETPGQKRDKLLKQSLFTELEQNFIQDLKNNGSFRRIVHCFDRLKSEIENTGNFLENRIKQLENSLEEVRTKKKNIEIKITLIKDSYQKYNFPKEQLTLSYDFKNKLREKLYSDFENLRKSEQYDKKLVPDGTDENVERNIQCKASVLTDFLNGCSKLALDTTKKMFDNAYIDDLVFIEDDKHKTALQIAGDSIEKESERLKNFEIKLDTNLMSEKYNKIGDLDDHFEYQLYEVPKYEKTRVLGILWESKGINFNKRKIYDEIVVWYLQQIDKLIKENKNAVNRVTDIVKGEIENNLKHQLAECETEKNNYVEKISVMESDKVLFKAALIKIRDLVTAVEPRFITAQK